GPGLRDRVIYRELFPFGLTVADLSPTVRPIPVSLTHVAARQELRSVMAAAGVEGYSVANEVDEEDEPQLEAG
ncbi:division plane positioning ATPase MipZ, partial [Acinetobacter baumannii]